MSITNVSRGKVPQSARSKTSFRSSMTGLGSIDDLSEMARSRTGGRAFPGLGSGDDFYCGPCRDEHIAVIAKAFCQDCVCYVCHECCVLHQKLPTTRPHAILYGAQMPRKPSEFFIRGEYQRVLIALQELKNQFGAIKQEKIKNISDLKQYSATALNDVRVFRKKVNKMLDKLENDAIKDIETMSTAELKKLNDQIIECSSTISQHDKEIGRLNTAMGSNKAGPYEMCKKAALFVKANSERKLELESMKQITIEFTASKELAKMIEKTSKIGLIRTHQSFEHRKPAPFDRLTAYFEESFDTKTVGDKANDFNITGIDVLRDGKIIIADHKNDKIKLYSPKYAILSSLLLRYAPWDVAGITEYSAICSLVYGKMLQFLEISNDSLKITNKIIETKGQCHGVVHFDNKLIVGIQGHKPRVEMLDMRGNSVKTIFEDKFGVPLFTFPRYICINKSERKMLVSDNGGKTIIEITMDGTIKNISDLGANRPDGITMDAVGNAYFCNNSSSSIEIMSADGGSRRPLLTRNDNIIYPQAICYNEESSTLITSLQDSSEIKIYKVL